MVRAVSASEPNTQANGGRISRDGRFAELAQTFTVGIAGTLTRVELQLWEIPASVPTEDLIVEIRRTINGVPDNNESGVLASAVLPASAVPVSAVPVTLFTSVDLRAAHLLVTTGENLAIVLRTFDTATGYVWTVKEFATYAGGGSFFRNTRFPFFQSSNRIGGIPVDSGFRTFVEPARPTLDQIVANAREAVANGTLTGAGPGASAPGRLRAWLQMIVEAQQSADAGRIDEACEQLRSAYKKADGMSPPPDFVHGTAAPGLASVIEAVGGDLGCFVHEHEGRSKHHDRDMFEKR